MSFKAFPLSPSIPFPLNFACPYCQADDPHNYESSSGLGCRIKNLRELLLLSVCTIPGTLEIKVHDPMLRDSQKLSEAKDRAKDYERMRRFSLTVSDVRDSDSCDGEKGGRKMKRQARMQVCEVRTRELRSLKKKAQ